ncbi:MAG: type II toxin-antitoxin system HicB family antitoxin [Chloroflexi bacterium]|nr:type II toxin-antitoxin system HicB family antitoxin [Chloroflexota bacterium]
MREHFHYNVLLEWDADDHVWVSYVPDLDYLSTFGETREEAIAHTREAILGYLEAARKEGIPVPTSSSRAELIDIAVSPV